MTGELEIEKKIDGRVRNREIVVFGQFYAKYFHKKQFHYAQIVLHCE